MQTSTQDTGDRLERAGARADRSAWVDRTARVGLVAYASVYLLIAWAAAELAFGKRSGNASAKGALAQLADDSVGQLVVWAIAVGLLLLVVWRLVEAAVGHREQDGAARVVARLASLGRGVIYGALGVMAVGVAAHSGHSKSPKTITARLMDLPAGQWLVGAVGLGIVAYGGALVWRGCTDAFLDNLDGRGRSGEVGRAYAWLGRVGHVAKGVAFALVGCLFCYAALTHEPRKSGGLDQALREVVDQPFGPVLLLLVAVGIACFGLFCLAWARHLSR